MIIDVDITHPSPDGLSETEWRFRFSDYHADPRLILHFYVERARKTKRHKFTPTCMWGNYHAREDTMAVKDVPLPGGVANQALAQFMSRLTVTGPNDAGAK